VIAALVAAVFFMVQLVPGDPITNAIGDASDPARIAQLKHEYHLDGSLWQQFAYYVDRLIHGDLGTTYVNPEPVSEILRNGWANSLELAGAGLFLALGVGITMGMIAAAVTREGRHRRSEVSFLGLTSIVGAVPDYLMATLFVFLFGVRLRWLPVSGAGSFETLILPAVAISTHSMATLARIVRVETLNVLAQDYVRTARSDRLPAWTIYFRHVLPNALTAALTYGGLIFANIFGAAVIVEVIFNRTGLGSALVSAVLQKELGVVQGITLILGFTIILMNLAVDVILALIDPRSMVRQS
jgi:peptide/nickel transport system permease protein